MQASFLSTESENLALLDFEGMESAKRKLLVKANVGPLQLFLSS
jgi:hypothetical protein